MINKIPKHTIDFPMLLLWVLFGLTPSIFAKAQVEKTIRLGPIQSLVEAEGCGCYLRPAHETDPNKTWVFTTLGDRFSLGKSYAVINDQGKTENLLLLERLLVERGNC